MQDRDGCLFFLFKDSLEVVKTFQTTEESLSKFALCSFSSSMIYYNSSNCTFNALSVIDNSLKTVKIPELDNPVTSIKAKDEKIYLGFEMPFVAVIGTNLDFIAKSDTLADASEV